MLDIADDGSRRQSAEQALTVVRRYERRWCIEDYHKAWKSGGGDCKARRIWRA
jgi:hypothetical protein